MLKSEKRGAPKAAKAANEVKAAVQYQIQRMRVDAQLARKVEGQAAAEAARCASHHDSSLHGGS